MCAVIAIASIIAIIALFTYYKNQIQTLEPTQPKTTEPTELPTQPFTSPPTEEPTEAVRTELEKFIDLAIAYGECQPEYPVDERGCTKYGEMFGHPKEAWCTEFVMWCLKQDERDMDTNYIGTVYPYSDYSGGCIEKYKDWGRLRLAKSGYIPKRGDMVFFTILTQNVTDHTGFVIGTEEIDGEIYILTIEGNIPTDKIKCIRKRRLLLSDSTIYAYGITDGN